MVRNVPRASRMASAATVRSSRSRIRSAALMRHVGAGAQGQPEVGRGQRGRVVDAVADHGHRVAVGLQAADDRGLVVGQRLRDDLVDTDLGGDGAGGGGVVAGEQDGAQARARAAAAIAPGGRGLHRVGKARRRRATTPSPRRAGPWCGRRPPSRCGPRRGRRGWSGRVRRAAGPGRPAPRGRRPGRARRGLGALVKSVTSGSGAEFLAWRGGGDGGGYRVLGGLLLRAPASAAARRWSAPAAVLDVRRGSSGRW